MFDIDKWQEIWHTVAANKMRSIMTGFGVFWGIFILVILIGMGNSLEGGILKNVEGFAPNSCFFFTNQTSEPYKGFRKGRNWNMNNKDIEIIKQRSKLLQHLSPMLFGGSSAKNVVIGRKSTSAQVVGVYPSHFQIQTQTVLAGRLFNDLDTKDDRKVALIGKKVCEELFGNVNDAVGQYIRVNGIYFQVIGVIRPKSRAQIGSDAESSVYIPFTTMQKAFNQGDIIHFMGATVKPGYPASALEDEIKTILKSNHDIAPNDEKAIRSFNIEKEFEMFNILFMGIGALMWVVGLGSLFSGIVGVSNIMLVTVRERTREIGVRRALGAKPITILIQIMSESFILTFIAGFAGLVLGLSILELISAGIRSATEEVLFIPPFISFWTALASMIILVCSGLFAGFIPALRALKIKAIDAIRDE